MSSAIWIAELDQRPRRGRRGDGADQVVEAIFDRLAQLGRAGPDMRACGAHQRLPLGFRAVAKHVLRRARQRAGGVADGAAPVETVARPGSAGKRKREQADPQPDQRRRHGVTARAKIENRRRGNVTQSALLRDLFGEVGGREVLPELSPGRP